MPYQKPTGGRCLQQHGAFGACEVTDAHQQHAIPATFNSFLSWSALPETHTNSAAITGGDGGVGNGAGSSSARRGARFEWGRTLTNNGTLTGGNEVMEFNSGRGKWRWWYRAAQAPPLKSGDWE
jgi:hypothetical protein